jgi:hypothetical protein
MIAAFIAATLGDAARDAAARRLVEGRRLRVALLLEPNTDFNDVLSGRVAAKANEARHEQPRGA